MSVCVNTNSREFKDAAKRLNISENSLENIVHEYVNTEGNVDSFPSDSYILSKVAGEPLTEISDKAQQLINLKYSRPTVVDSYAEAQAVANEMSQYFDPKHIGIKENYAGKYEVSLNVLRTPIKEKYKGKLIFAQSGTGKSRIADNINVIDSDTLLADVLGTSVESARFALINMDLNQREAVTNEYHQRIREELAKGKTVLTASAAMMHSADVVVYNESSALTSARTSAADREGNNRYVNPEKAESDIIRAKAQRGKEVISLDSEHYLSDYLLTDPSFAVPKKDQRADSLSEAVSSFLQDFSLTVNDLEGYRGRLPLFDAVNRVINARKASDITDAMGYAVAFMMQQEPSLRRLFVKESINQLFPGAQELFSEEFIEKVLSNDREKSIKLPIGVAKLFGRKYVTPSEIYAHIPGKNRALKTLGKEISKTLREYYEGKEPSTFIQRAWNIIKEFFNKVTRRSYYQERLDFINKATDAIIRKDPSFMRGPEYKIGSTTRASLLDLETAFKDNPFEDSIIKTLGELNISLAGSASIRAFGTIFRPANNPLHDIDFNAPGFRSREELTKALESVFPHIQHFRSIRSRDNINEYTESYVLLDRDFHLEKAEDNKLSIIDDSTNEVIAKVNLKTNEIEDATIPDMKSKLLDFFINTKEDGKYGNHNITINNEEYIVSDSRGAWEAKAKWQRRKDLWDWARFTPNELFGNEPSASFNIEGKSLKEFLRDKGLIHTYDPSLGNTDVKAMYVTKGDGTYSMRSLINEIYTTLRMNGISPDVVSFERTKAGNAMKVIFNNAEDTILREKNKKLADIKKTVDFLQARIPALKGRVHYATIEEAENALGRELKANENSFVKDGQVYLVGRRFTQDIAIEECLHPFTATLKYENLFLYNRLLAEAKETFPKLWEDVVSNYSSKDFSVADRENELVTQALARSFREVYNTTEDSQRKTFIQYVKQFINWFRNLFYRVNPMTGNQIIDLNTIKPDMTFRELAELINTSDTEFSVGFEEKTRFNKERLQISDYEKEFITESLVIPGVSESTIRNFMDMWTTAQTQASDVQMVTIPYSQWKALDAKTTSHATKRVGAIESTVLNEISRICREDWDINFVYDKATKQITVPEYAVTLAKMIPEALQLEDQIFADLTIQGYDLETISFNIVDALDTLLSENMSAEDFFTEVGGEFYYSDSRQGLLFDENGNPTEDARVDEDGLSVVKPTQVRPELAKFQDATSKMITQLNNLLDSDLMSNTEVRHVAEQAVYFLSDSITNFLENPSKVFEIFPELGVKEGRPMTAEEQQKEIERIKGMSRVELAKYLTPERLIEFTKVRLFSPEGNPNINNRKLIKKAQLIRDNFDAIIRFANDAFAIVEDFAITSVDNKLSIVEDMAPTIEDYDNTNDADAILENEGSLQEHWQIESRTLDVMSSMSQLVKQSLNRCFQVRINPETGVEENVPSEFGIAERMNAKDATASILRWTRGAESLSHMLQILESKSAENPWIKQTLNRLKDTSGKESDFQSQFYGVFAKAFQPYSVIVREKNPKTGEYEYKSIQVNQHPALTDATQAIEVAFKTNTHPLFENMRIKKDSLDALTSIADTLVEKAKNKLEENDRAEIVDLLFKAATALGHSTDVNLINLALDSNATFNTLVNKLKAITNNLNAALTKENYDPFKFRGENSIGGYLKDFLKPLTEKLEETAVSSFYDSGKMYQSYVTPSYLTVMMNHFTSEDTRFQEWIDTEYGQYEWFKNADGSWRNVWLETLDGMSQEDRKDLFKHKVQLNFNKHNYMRNMSDVEYALSIMSEYFSEYSNAKGNSVSVWYRVPMMSNKPSSEFIRMYAYTGAFMKPKLIDGFSRIFQQELSRIQTVDIRDYDKKNPNFIKNFDKNGRKFVILDFFNKYLEGGSQRNSELGNLINKTIEKGTESLTIEEHSRLDQLVSEEIEKSMDAKADAILRTWKSNGIFEGAKQIANIGKEDAVVEQKLREFIWNDTFAAMNILELTVTDPAFYKDAEDLQKRLAQIHAPGIRANIEATDYNGNRVTDGKFRTILLKDFDDFVSNIKDNLRIVFDRKLKELENSGVSREDSRYKAAAATYENIIDQFNGINVADAQGYSSPTSYRKKAFIFGKWSRKSEEIYNKLKEGKYNFSDLQTAFQPLKPFVYGQITKPGIDAARRDIATPLTNLKVPVQFKNSEYLLIMADAILQNEDTGRPNLLRAIYEIMEESAEGDNTKGIDTIQFESTCKSGLMAPIDIKQFSNVPGGETMAKLALTQAIYNEDGSYNTDTYVYEVPFENYAIQQEVPEHFKEHFQAHGSQIRYIIPTDLESVNSKGEAVTYDYFDRGEEKKLTAEEFKREYEDNISQNIEDSIKELSQQLGIGDEFMSKKDRNIALSNILLKEVLSSPRYGAELAAACTVNSETGEFNIPLGDPIQSKRIEQLINSIVKNRINKQEIAGGPVVQVTNFGTSRELNIRFNSKDGGLLMTRAEFEKSNREGSYEDYIRDNQAGIAYYEVFAPIFSNELFEKFADKNGNIDIETIEKINPDLLKMIGYRIPTEDKYSMAPLKIVGFLPREAGDGIMLPNDITLLTGSDFDVDKFYLMRKEINIVMRQLGPESINVENFDQAAREYTKNHREILEKHLKNYIHQNSSKAPFNQSIFLTEEEENEAANRATRRAEYRRDAENKRHEAALADINRGREVANEGVERRAEENKYSENQEAKVSTQFDKAIERENKYHQRRLNSIEADIADSTKEGLQKAQERKINNIIRDFLESPLSKQSDPTLNALRDEYIKYMFDYVEPTEGTTYRNNKIVDMSWAVLTNETTASKMLTPGGFEPQKRMGYLISAYQNPSVKLTWEELNSVTNIDDLKSLCYTDKNLCYIDTHLQFYKQNSAASTALGMAAVQKVAHAVLESNGFHINVSEALNFENDESFSIAGKEFSGLMEIDRKYNDEGALIGRTLGEFVAMFADAVKDPVANLMNINNTTMPIVTTLIRFGMPFEKVALFISQPIIRKVLALYNSENVTNFVTLKSIIEKEISSIEEEFEVEDNSVLKELNEITEDELIKGLRQDFKSNADTKVFNYKVLKFFQYFDTLSQKLKSPTYATRFNSISNAVGPLVIDNLIMEHKIESGDFDNFYDRNGEEADFSTILNMHPILRSFYKTLDISNTLLDDMPANSQSFRKVLYEADNDAQRVLFSDRKLLGELSDFFQSYLLVASGVVPAEATQANRHQGLEYYINKFPTDFMKANAKELFKGNPLIDAIKLDIQKGKAVLKIDTTGLTTQDKERLGDGWTDLYRSGERGRKLAEHLFYYNFWRTGIGFSPKSFMGLFPTRLKTQISGYNKAFTVHNNSFASNVDSKLLLEMFVRNNADNNKLVPKVKIGKEGANPVIMNGTYIFSGNDYTTVKDKFYIKIKSGNRTILLARAFKDNKTQRAAYKELSLLGNNGEYFEASLNPNYQPISNTTETKEQVNEGQMKEVSNAEVHVEDTPEVSNEPTQSEQFKRATKIKNMLLKMFQMSGRTEAEAQAKIDEFKAKSENEKRQLKSPMKKFIANKFEQLGIKYDEKLLDEMYENLC